MLIVLSLYKGRGEGGREGGEGTGLNAWDN